MKRIDIWKACDKKNPQIEKLIAGTSEKNMIRGKVYTKKEFSNILNIDTPNNVLPLKVYPDPHSVILVKNKFLEKGIAIFDPNGYVDMYGNVDIDNMPFYVETEDITEELFDQVSPQRPLNRGKDSVNPGYCNIFGIIFIVYFKNTSHINGWNVSWVNFVNKIWEPLEKEKKGKSDSIALQLAAEVQLIIKNNINYSIIENEILDKIKQYFSKVKITFPNSSTNKRKRTDFGKIKYKYNNRLYVIHTGPKGGKYILVDKLKKYIKS